MKRIVLITSVAILSAFVITSDAYGVPNRKPEPSHDVAITDISVPSSCIQGDAVPVVITVKDQGNCSEKFAVTLTDTTDGIEIGIQSVTLSAAGQGGMDESVDLIFDSPVSGKQNFGYPVVCGDVNGDGYDDLLVGASQWNNGTGRAYLYYGGTNMDTTPDKIFTGQTAADLFGDGGAALGDINGDNYYDVLVGAPGHRGGAQDGRVYIFYGGPDMDEVADLTLDGESGGGGYYGATIVTGDVNNDSYEDVVVTAILMNSQKGRAYLYYGGDPMDNTCDLTFDGENATDWFGRKAYIGDSVNDDNYADLLIGARKFPDSLSRGRAYLYYGGSPMNNISDMTFTGQNDGDQFGEGLCIVDLDNDSYADAIVSAPVYNSYQGRIYLYYGGTGMDEIADKTFEGEPGVGAMLLTMAGGHFNNDDYGDYIDMG